MEWLVKVLIVTVLFGHCLGKPVLLTGFIVQHTSDSAIEYSTTSLNFASTPSSHSASTGSGQDSISTSITHSRWHEDSASQFSATESQALTRQTTTPSSSSSSLTDGSGTQSDHNDSVINSVREVNRPTRARVPTNRGILIQRILREVHLYTNTMRGQHDSETNTGLSSHRGRDGDTYHDDYDTYNPNAADNSDDGHINNDDGKIVDNSSSNDTDIRPDNGDSNNSDNSRDNGFEIEDDDSDNPVLSHDQLVDVILKDSSFTDASLRQDLANMSRDSLLNLLHELSRLRSAATGITSTPVYTDTGVMQPQQLQNKTVSLSSLSIGDVCCSVG